MPSWVSSVPACGRTSTRSPRTAGRSPTCRSSSTRRRSRTCPPRVRCSRSGSTARGSRACTCGSARWRVAVCAGQIDARTSGPRSSASSRRRWSRTPSSCRRGRRAGSTRSSCPTRRSTVRRGSTKASPRYKMFISGLLDLTDNLVSGEVVPPARVVRHDGDDTYLVVAADKGTAKFSDLANGISADYGFWLDDAFASGGSAGYDHKGMGITARGAWESVKRHFREMGVDTQTQPFTVVGVGDMSGDVFGNGMLLSEHIRLVAAFDHRHVFIDPDPRPGDLVRRTSPALRAARLVVGRLRPLPHLGGRRRVRPVTQVGADHQRDGPGPGAAIRDQEPDPGRADEGHPHRPGRPAVERRHRHLHQGKRGEAFRDRRPGQRRDPGQRRRPALQGRRRGRQPRCQPARPDRGRAGGRQDQHRCHRQQRWGRHAPTTR